MDPRRPQNEVSHPAHGFELDEATRASFQYSEQTFAFPTHGQAASMPDSWNNHHQNSITDQVQGRTSVQDPAQISSDPDYGPSGTVPDIGNGRHGSVVDPNEQRVPAQSPDQPSTSSLLAASTPVPSTSNDYQGSAMPTQGRASAQSPRQTSTCPMNAPQVLVPVTRNGHESSEIDATQRNYVHGPTTPARWYSTYRSQRIPSDSRVPRQRPYQPQRPSPVSRPRIEASTAGLRAGPVQQSFALYPERGDHAQTQQLRPRDIPSPYLAGAAVDSPIELDAGDDEEGKEPEDAVPHQLSPPARTNPYGQRPQLAFLDRPARSYSTEEGNAPPTGSRYLQQTRGQVSSSSNGRLNIPSYGLPASTPQEHTETGHVNRRKRSRSLFEGDEHHTLVAGGVRYTPSSVGNRPLSGHISEGYDSFRGDDVDEDEDAEEEEVKYGDLGVRQAPPKRRRLGNGGIAQDRPTYLANDLGGPARPAYPIDDLNDTYPATFPIDDGLGSPPTGASTGSRPIGRRARGNHHGELRQDGDGHIIFRAHGSQQWEPTRYHDEARAEMIAHMAQVGQYGEFSGGRQPERGTDPLDVTSFNPPQHRWYFSAESGRADWDESQDPYLYRYERRGLQNPNYEPGPLRFQGFVILNNRDHQPMTEWRHLPLTISSEISGGWMENIQRIDSRISVNDFQDRMPRTRVTNRSALTNRMGRFRISNGLASWNCRDGTIRIKERMLRHLTDEQIRDNTTKGYDGLTKEELAEIERQNKDSGKYDKRAGKNAKRRR